MLRRSVAVLILDFSWCPENSLEENSSPCQTCLRFFGTKFDAPEVPLTTTVSRTHVYILNTLSLYQLFTMYTFYTQNHIMEYRLNEIQCTAYTSSNSNVFSLFLASIKQWNQSVQINVRIFTWHKAYWSIDGDLLHKIWRNLHLYSIRHIISWLCETLSHNFW